MFKSKKVKSAATEFFFAIVVAFLVLIMAENVFRLFGLKISMQQLVNYVPHLTLGVFVLGAIFIVGKFNKKEPK